MTVVKCPLNYVGGKTKLLPQILEIIPKNIDTFVDVFGGGFNVGVNVDAKHLIYNDILTQVKSLIEMFYNETFENIDKELKRLEKEYDFLNLTWERMSDDDKEYKKAQYIKLRSDYNQSNDPYKLFLLICSSFSNQIRFNRNNEFNMPFGKRYYNNSIQKNLREFCNKIKEYECSFYSLDFRTLIKSMIDEKRLTKNDFLYFDPPYLISNAVYNEKSSNNGWNITDEMDLYSILDELNSNGYRWGLSNVLENNNRINDILKNWIKDDYNVYHLNVNYSNCNYHRKNKSNDSDEVLITNFGG